MREHAIGSRRVRALLAICALSVLISACTTTSHHKPKHANVETEGLPRFSDSPLLDVRNIQKNGEGNKIVFFNGNVLTVDYGEYTEMLVEELRETLAQQGAHLEDGAPRRLDLSVLHANVFLGGVYGSAFRCHVDVKVETAENYVRGYDVVRSASNPKRACNAAIATAAATVTLDPAIQTYVTGD